MKIENDNDRLILISAFRYGLGRMTYIVGTITDEIVRNWESLTASDQTLIRREINDAIRAKQAGMGCDVAEWRKVLALKGGEDEKWQRTFLSEDFKDGEIARGGMFYRTMKLGKFIKECEDKGYRIVGLRVDEDNNGELIFIPPPGELIAFNNGE